MKSSKYIKKYNNMFYLDQYAFEHPKKTYFKRVLKSFLIIIPFILIMSAVSIILTTNNDKYEKGILTETSFTSKYLQISFTVPDGYIIATEDETEKLLINAGEQVFKDDIKKEIDFTKLTKVLEMFVQMPIGLPNVSLYVEMTQKNMTITQYIDAVKKKTPEIITVETIFDDNITDVIIAGQLYKKVTARVNYQGVKIIQNYFLRKIDNRITGITLTFNDETMIQANELLAAFKPYK